MILGDGIVILLIEVIYSIQVNNIKSITCARIFDVLIEWLSNLRGND
jgi:hypothetical protein